MRIVVALIGFGEVGTVLAAAESATGLAKDAWCLAVNSASPGRKQAAAAVIERAGGRYVEAASCRRSSRRG